MLSPCRRERANMEEKFIQTMQEVKARFITFRQDEVLLANGNKGIRDFIVHGGAVGIVAVTAQREIVLVRQYRHPVEEDLLEIPAGKLEKGEDPLIAAKRELAEETGFRAASWKSLTAIYTSPGTSSEKLHLFLAEDLTADEAHPDEDELVEYKKFPLSEVLEMIGKGNLKDAKSIVGILMYLQSAIIQNEHK